jgi:hypothetical protein
VKTLRIKVRGAYYQALFFFETEEDYQEEDRDKGTLICVYNGTWYEVNKDSRHIWVGDPRPDIHQYDLPLFTPESIAPILAEANELLFPQQGPTVSPSRSNPATEVSEEEGARSEEGETDTDEQPDPINLQIREQEILLTSPMSTQTVTRTQEEIEQSEPLRTTTDPQDVVRSLYSSLGRSFVPGGPGGPGGTGPPVGPGPGGPNDPGGPPNFGPAHQIPIPDAQDVKMMGALPEKFTGDRTQAQNFLDTIKGYI